MNGWRGVIKKTPPRRLALSHDSAATSCTSLSRMDVARGKGHNPRRLQNCRQRCSHQEYEMGHKNPTRSERLSELGQ